MIRTLIPVLCIFAAAGCSGTGDNPGAPPSPKSTSSPSDGASTTPASSANPNPSAPSVTLKDVPPGVRTDAYHYFGLTNAEPLKLEMTQPGQPATTGTLKTELTSVKDGQALFDIEYTDGLSRMGQSSVRASAKGIYDVSLALGKLDHDDLELPAKLNPGTAWSSHNTIKTEAEGTIKQDISIRVVGVQSVKTKAQTYKDALYISGTGTMVVNGKKIDVTERAWYVKDKGPVRQELTQKIGVQPASTTIIQEIK